MNTIKTQKAELIQVLLWYDKPEVLLLKSGVAEYILAIRSGDPDSNNRTYIGGSMTYRRLRDYFDGKCDLRFAISHANMRKFWKFEFGTDTRIVDVNHIKRSDHELLMSLPDSGLFSRDHDPIGIFQNYVPNTKEQFLIDGSWDLGEFSQFYGQVEDIYYIVSDIERFDDPSINAKEKSIITDAFDRSWDGGGSYVAFYRKVANDNDYHSPLRVSGIKYNSPGYVEIHANKEPFDGVMVLLKHYSVNENAARKAYNAIGTFMSANKLKKQTRSSVITDKTISALEDYAEKLQIHMPGVSFQALKAMTGSNSIVAAKVMLSVFRRVERLYRFFDQGRVIHDRIDVDNSE